MPTYEIECPKCGELAEIFRSIEQRHDTPECFSCQTKMKVIISAVKGFVDFPAATGGYQSPATGKWIDTSAKRKDDFKESKTRPWEGKEQEVKEMERQQMYREQKEDKKLDDTVRSAYYALTPEQRKTLTNPK